MSIKIIPPEDIRIEYLNGTSVAIMGYGSQGEAHALNLRDAGCSVMVAQRPGGARYEAAIKADFQPVSIETAARTADLLIFGLPDDAVAEIYHREIEPYLRSGQTLGFIHGFAIHYRLITPPENVDVVMVAPKSQGRGVRSEYAAGRGVFALLAIHQAASGRARRTALGWAAGIGAHRAGLLETTFKDEAETDLFGEQAVLCGGLSALIKAGFETLVEAGYPPELAYFECCHEIKLLADLIYEGGITHMRESISSAARFGDLTRGPRLIDRHVRDRLRDVLNEIQSGQFARELLEDVKNKREKSRELLERDREHLIEKVGHDLRAMLFKPAAD